jgi:hypothetical protein
MRSGRQWRMGLIDCLKSGKADAVMRDSGLETIR